MHRQVPAGIILVAGLLGLVGTASVIASLTAITLGLDRVPAWMEFQVLTYGVAALLTVALIWSRSLWARWAFLGWSVLLQYVWLILWPEFTWQLVPGIAALIAVLVVTFRYIDRWCRA